MALDEISKGSVKSGPPPPSAEGGGGPDFTLPLEISSRAILVIPESSRHSLVILSIPSVKSGPPPPSAEGGGVPDF